MHSALGVLTVAVELGNLAGALALLAAVLPVGTFGGDEALARWMGAFLGRRHGSPPAATLRLGAASHNTLVIRAAEESL